MEKERRYLKTKNLTELRAKRNEGGGGTIEGYAAKYNVISEDLGGFREVLLPGCFDLENSPDIVCNREHNDDDPLGRTISGTLEVTADDVGLAFNCNVADTSLGRDTLVLIGRGDLQDCSFAFCVPEDESGEEWDETDDGTPLRKIKKCVLFDVACVMHPAYPQTEVALRSLSARTKATERKKILRPISVRKRRLDLLRKDPA